MSRVSDRRGGAAARVRNLGYRLGPARYYAPAYERLVDFMGPLGERFLDVGCGGGGLTRAVAARGEVGRVVGLDRDPRMLRSAARAARGLPQIEWREADAAATGLEPGSVTSAAAVQVAHHWSEPGDVFQELRRVVSGAVWIFEAAADLDPDPEGWVRRRAGLPPLRWLRWNWRRFGMDAPRWSALRSRAEGAGLVIHDEGVVGFYRYFCAGSADGLTRG